MIKMYLFRGNMELAILYRCSIKRLYIDVKEDENRY